MIYGTGMIIETVLFAATGLCLFVALLFHLSSSVMRERRDSVTCCVIARLFVAAACTAALAFALQQPRPIPTHPPDGNSQHDGQPSFCVNVDGKWKANCHCKNMLADANCSEPDSGGESSKCSVWCRRDSCKCVSDCQRTR